MEFEKITPPSLKELFITQIHKMILSGSLQIGDKLPSERQLAELMNVSRSVVNSGIVELEHQGFIDIKPRVGAFIADYRKKGNLETLLAIMRFNGGKLGNNEIRSILELRIALDNITLRNCIPHITDEDTRHLLEIVEHIKKSTSFAEASEAAFEFQHELALLSTNTLVPLLMQSFKLPIMGLWEHFCSLYGIEALYQNTYTLWQYIHSRNLEGAIDYVDTSIQASIDGDRTIFY